MMLCVKTMRAYTEKFVDYWAQGTNGKIINPIPNDQPMPEDEYFYFGILRGSGDMMKRGGHDYYFCDHAYFNAGHDNNPSWYRIVKNGHVLNTIQDSTPDRYEKYFKQDLVPYSTTGSHVVVCPPTGAIEWFFDTNNWLDTTVKTLKQHTDREIIVRDKPLNPKVKVVDGKSVFEGIHKTKPQGSLDEALQDAWCVVTFNSTVAIKALVQGVPVICGPECSAYPLATKIENIESPRRDDREPWLWSLAENQFTTNEMSSGYAYNKLIA